MPSTKHSNLDTIFASFDVPGSPGCAFSVIRDGEIIHKAGYGSAQLEYGIPITSSTVFHVASVSKQFTTYCILRLTADGKLALDDDIREYIPELNPFSSTVTIRHLIHHISGLRDQWTLLNIAGWRPDDVITKEHVLKLLYAQTDLNFPPGDEFLYCNSGYSLLAEIVERVSGLSFRLYAEEQVFAPLSMDATHVHDDHEEIVPGRAYSYTPDGDQGYKKSVLSFANHGATSLFTTVEDLAIWMQNFESRNVGGNVLEQMTQTGRLNNGEEIEYGFGLTVSTYRGAGQLQHSGSDAGFLSHLLMIPEHRFGVAVLSNVSHSAPGKLAHQVADGVLSDKLGPEEEQEDQGRKEERTEGAGTFPDDCQGTYESPELCTRYEIIHEGERLLARHARHPDIEFKYESQDTLKGNRVYFQTVRFQRNTDGKITGFLLSCGRVRNLRFNRLFT